MATLYSAVQATPDASETEEGKLRIATNAEGLAGTDDVTAMTPLKVANAIAASAGAAVGNLRYKGAYDASLQTPDLTTALKGDFYLVSVGGSVDGVVFNVGDHLVFNQDASSPITSAMFDKIDSTDAVNSVNTQTGAVVLTASDVGAIATGSNVSALTNDAGYITSIPSASETTAGVIEIATNAEAGAASASDKALVPSNIASFSIGANQVSGLATVATTGGYADLIGSPTLGTASALDAGTSASNVVQLDGSAKLPAVDGSQLTNLPSASAASETTAGVIEIATNAEAGAASASDKALVPSNIASFSIGANQVSGLATVATTGGYADLIGSPTLGTASALDAGTSASNVVQLDGSAKLPAVDGSQLTNLPSASAASETTAGVIEIATNAEAGAASASDKALVPSNIASFSIGANQVSGLATVATTGGYADLIGSPTLGTASALDAGTSASNVVQLDGSAKLPAVDGSQLTNLPSASAASETTAGVIEIATNTEAGAASASDKALVPSNIASFSIGANQVSGLATVATTGGYADLIGSPTLGTASALDAGTSASNVVQLDGSAKLPAVDGSQLTNLPSASAASETVAGVIEIATNAEAGAASATDKALVPSNISSIALSAFNNDLSFISNISEDTSPQLGGDLDLNGNDIVTASNADLELAPNGTGTVVLKGNQTGGNNPGSVKFNCEQNSHGVSIKGPAHSASATYTLTLPTSTGTANQVLKTDGTGVLNWTDQASSAPTLTTATPSADYTITTSAGIEEIYKLTPSASISVFLPSAATAGSGYKYNIKNMSTYTITVDPNGSETIDGSTTYSLNVQYQNLTLCSDGTNWIIL